MSRTAEEQLADALAERDRLAAENERLRAALPPEPGAPGQRWRQGRSWPQHLYVHDDGHPHGHPHGHPVGQMPSARYAALVCAAVNAWLRPRADSTEVKQAIVHAIDDPGAYVGRGDEEPLAEWSARAVLAAIALGGRELADYGELSRALGALDAVRELCDGGDPAVAARAIRELLGGAP